MSNKSPKVTRIGKLPKFRKNVIFALPTRSDHIDLRNSVGEIIAADLKMGLGRSKAEVFKAVGSPKQFNDEFVYQIYVSLLRNKGKSLIRSAKPLATKPTRVLKHVDEPIIGLIRAENGDMGRQVQHTANISPPKRRKRKSKKTKSKAKKQSQKLSNSGGSEVRDRTVAEFESEDRAAQTIHKKRSPLGQGKRKTENDFSMRLLGIKPDRTTYEDK